MGFLKRLRLTAQVESSIMDVLQKNFPHVDEALECALSKLVVDLPERSDS